MRFWAAIVVAHVTVYSAASASPKVSREEAAEMQADAMANLAASRIHGSFDFVLEDPDIAVDQTTGRGSDNPYNDWAHTPIRAKRSDGSTVVKKIDVCD